MRKSNYLFTIFGCSLIIITLLFDIFWSSATSSESDVYRYIVISAALLVIVLALFKYVIGKNK